MLDFPITPANGQLYTGPNEITYQWQSSPGVWTSIASPDIPPVSITVSPTAPTNPIDNMLWWNSILGVLMLYYNDGNTTQWVPATPTNMAGGSGALSGNGRVYAADYGCSPAASGTTNRVAIQAVLDIGGEVELPQGTIPLDNVSLIPRSNTNLYGHGNGTILARTGNDASSYLKPFFDILNVHDVTFDGITWLHTVVTSREYGIRFGATTLGGTANIRIRNCSFLNAPNHIQRFVKNVWWTNNLFDGGGAAGAQCGFATGGDVTSGGLVPTDGLVEKIYAIGNTFTRTREEGIDINQDTQHVVIDGNSFIDCNLAGGVTNEAIDIGGVNSMATGCRNVTVSNNNISWTTATNSTGINVKIYSQDITLSGNTLNNATTTSGAAGILVTDFARNVTITGNTVRGFRIGISLSGATIGTCENISIVGNAVDGASAGAITIATGVWTGIVIKGNTLTPLISASQAIGLANVTRWLVEGNVIRSSGTDGILVNTTATDGSLVDNNVSGSAFDGIRVLGTRVNVTGNSAYLNGRIGISVIAAHVNVVGNSAFNNAQSVANQFGISVGAGSNFCVVTGNKVYDDQTTKTQNGIVFGISDRVIFNGNVVYPVMTTALSGTGNLTNSLVGVAGNITA